MPNEIIFDFDKNDKVLKLIPIIKDIDNPENMSIKFKLGIITSTIEIIKNNHNYGYRKSRFFTSAYLFTMTNSFFKITFLH